MSKIIILTVDGGGIKGVIPSYILNEIEQKLSKKCYQMFDMIGGTSTGGIIAAALTSPINGNQPLKASDVLKMYQNDGSEIFVSQTSLDVYALYYADNGRGKGVEPYLKSKLGSQTLSKAKANMQAIGGRTKQMFTTGYTINSLGNKVPNPRLGKDYGPYLFNWYDAGKYSADNYYIWEAARSTSAAPTYFPVAFVGGGAPGRPAPRWVVDGGVMSNNPTIWAISEVFRTGLASSLSDVIVISLGTGTYPSGAGLVTRWQGVGIPENGDWGYTPWVANNLSDLSDTGNGRGAIINIITEAVQLVSNQQMLAFQNSGLQYFRLEPVITRAQSQMDNYDPANITSLVNTTKAYLAGPGQATFTQVLNILKANTTTNTSTSKAAAKPAKKTTAAVKPAKPKAKGKQKTTTAKKPAPKQKK